MLEGPRLSDPSIIPIPALVKPYMLAGLENTKSLRSHAPQGGLSWHSPFERIVHCTTGGQSLSH